MGVLDDAATIDEFFRSFQFVGMSMPGGTRAVGTELLARAPGRIVVS